MNLTRDRAVLNAISVSFSQSLHLLGVSLGPMHAA